MSDDERPTRPNLFAVPPPDPEEEPPRPVNRNVVTFLEDALGRARRGEMVGMVLVFLTPNFNESGSISTIPKGRGWRVLALGELERAKAMMLEMMDPTVPVSPAPEDGGQPS